MYKTMAKPFSMSILFVMIMSLFFTLGTPILSHANDIGGVDVKVDDTGNLTIGGTSNFKDGASTGAWNDLIVKYRKFIVGISGIGAVSMIAFFIVQFMKLGASAGNPQARSQALGGVLWTGLAAAGLGAVTVIVGFFYNSIG